MYLSMLHVAPNTHNFTITIHYDPSSHSYPTQSPQPRLPELLNQLGPATSFSKWSPTGWTKPDVLGHLASSSHPWPFFLQCRATFRPSHGRRPQAKTPNFVRRFTKIQSIQSHPTSNLCQCQFFTPQMKYSGRENGPLFWASIFTAYKSHGLQWLLAQAQIKRRHLPLLCLLSLTRCVIPRPKPTKVKCFMPSGQALVSISRYLGVPQKPWFFFHTIPPKRPTRLFCWWLPLKYHAKK